MGWLLSYPLKLFSGHNENPTHKRAVVVEGVELRGGDMKRTLSWVAVLEGIVQWKEVYIMHCHVVTLLPAQQKSNVQQHGSVKPGGDNCTPNLYSHLL